MASVHFSFHVFTFHYFRLQVSYRQFINIRVKILHIYIHFTQLRFTDKESIKCSRLGGRAGDLITRRFAAWIPPPTDANCCCVLWARPFFCVWMWLVGCRAPSPGVESYSCHVKSASNTISLQVSEESEWVSEWVTCRLNFSHINSSK